MKAFKFFLAIIISLNLGLVGFSAFAEDKGVINSIEPSVIQDNVVLEEDTNTSKAKVYVIAGGDNAVGYGSISELNQLGMSQEYRDYMLGWGLENVKISYSVNANTQDENVSQGFVSMKAGAGASRVRFGPELGLAISLAEQEESAYIIKYALSSTQLYQDWSYFTGERFFRYVENALLQLENEDVEFELAGLVWFGAEHESMPGRYRGELSSFVDNFRQTFSKYGENTPFYNVGVTNDSNYTEAIRTYQKMMAYDENAYYIDTSDMSCIKYNFNNSVRKVLNGQSLITVGQRIYNASSNVTEAVRYEIATAGKNQSIHISNVRDKNGITFYFTQTLEDRNASLSGTWTNSIDFFFFWGDRSAIATKGGRPTPAEGLVRIQYNFSTSKETLRVVANKSSVLLSSLQTGGLIEADGYSYEKIADTQNDEYGVAVKFTYAQLSAFANNKSLTAYEPIYYSGLGSDTSASGSMYCVNAKGTKLGSVTDRGAIYDYAGIHADGQPYDALIGLDFTVIDELVGVLTSFSQEDVANNIAKITSEVSWTLTSGTEQTLENSFNVFKVGSSMFADVLTFNVSDGAPLAFMGLDYVQSRRKCTTTVTAVESGYVFFWSYKDLTVTGMTKIIVNGAGEPFMKDDIRRNTNYLQIAWLNAGESLTFTNSASSSGDDNGVFIAKSAIK